VDALVLKEEEALVLPDAVPDVVVVVLALVVPDVVSELLADVVRDDQDDVAEVD
jgi:hypothetical protein